MSSRHEMSRRDFLSGVAATPVLFAAPHVAPGFGSADPTVITKRVEKLYTVAGCLQPNDLQFTPEGLWILDQVDQPGNKAFLVKPETGAVIREIMTESIHGSGITYGKGAAILTMFERWVGPEKFQKGIQRYLAEHRDVGAVAELAELISVCAQLRADGSDGDGKAWARTATRLRSAPPVDAAEVDRALAAHAVRVG